MTKYNLEERTAKFGENVIIFCNKLPKNEVTRPLIIQLVKAATSVGANYCEADDAESREDFKHKREIHLIFNAIYRKIGLKKISHSLDQLGQLE